MDIKDWSSQTTNPNLPPPYLIMSFKRVDHYYNTGDKAWKHKDTDSELPAEAAQPVGGVAVTDNDWDKFDFVVVRKLPDPRRPYDNPTVTFKVVLKSSHLLNACREVIGEVPRLSWNSKPVEVSDVDPNTRAPILCPHCRSQLEPTLLIAFYPQLESYEERLRAIVAPSGDEEMTRFAFSALLEWLRVNYRSTLASLQELLSNGEITYGLLYGILIPGTTLVSRDGATGELRAVRLISFSRNDEQYALNCEGLEAADARKDATPSGQPRDYDRDDGSDASSYDGDGADFAMDEDEGYDGDREKQGSMQRVKQRAFGMSNRTLVLRAFTGTQKINRLGIFPMKYHPNPAHLRADLIRRGRKWASLCGVYHVYYRGLGGRQTCNGYARYNVSHTSFSICAVC